MTHLHHPGGSSLPAPVLSSTRRWSIPSPALAVSAAAQLVMSAASTAWAGERGFSTGEQIPPLIRKAHGREDLSQSATVWMWLITSLFSFWRNSCQGFFQLQTADIIFLLYLREKEKKSWQQQYEKKIFFYQSQKVELR